MRFRPSLGSPLSLVSAHCASCPPSECSTLVFLAFRSPFAHFAVLDRIFALSRTRLRKSPPLSLLSFAITTMSHSHTTRTCSICNVTSNSDASLQRHLQSKAHRTVTQRHACSQSAAAAASAATVASAASHSPPLSPIPSPASPLLEPLANRSAAAAESNRLPVVATSVSAVAAAVALPVTSSVRPFATSSSSLGFHSTHDHPRNVEESFIEQDGRTTGSAEADGQGDSSRMQTQQQQQPQQPQQQQPHTEPLVCSICDVQCHSKANLRDHIGGAAHAKGERVFVRGMHAALDYLSRCVSSAPAPPSSSSASTSASASSLPVLTESGEVNEFYLSTANPAFRALCSSLHAYEQGGAWRSFLDAVRAGMSVQQQWSIEFAVQQQAARSSFQGDQFEFEEDDGAFYADDIDHDACDFDEEEY